MSYFNHVVCVYALTSPSASPYEIHTLGILIGEYLRLLTHPKHPLASTVPARHRSADKLGMAYNPF